MTLGRRGALLAVLVVAQTLGVANANLIAVALPDLTAALEPSPAQAQWIVDAYVLVLASALIAAGALGDRWGHRRLLLAGLAAFGLASLACALASDPALLIGLRALQALGPALMLPASLAIIAATFTDRLDRARAIGIWGAASGVGIALGPLLGGVVTNGLGWRWAFAVNAPCAAVLLVLALRLVRRDGPRPARPPLDWAGALLILVAMAALVLAIIEAPAEGWTAPLVLVAAAAALLLLAAFARQERRHPAPLVDLALLGRRRFLAANLAAGTLLFTSLGATVYLSAFLQDFRAASPLDAGLALAPFGIATAATAAFAALAGRLTARVPPRALIAAGLLVAAAGTALLATVDAGADAAELVPGLLVLGVGTGLALPASTATAVSSTPAERAGMASAIHNAARQVGATLGVAVLGSIVIARSAGGGASAYAAGLRTAMVVAALALLAMLVATAWLNRPVEAPG